ncbi:lipoyl protein ligase domain-containing protein [Ottowia caeni]|uniref:lipoyl protein ligase domain-containing protein n=1 Tax=Ottowia caeni TaxID=2870339 RepID=UPI003D73C461
MPASSAAAREQIWNQAQLQNRVQTPAFRMWRYRLPAVVLGYSQRRLMQEVDARTGLEVLRRDSGGGAVLTGPWMLGLSVALPPEHALLGTEPDR